MTLDDTITEANSSGWYLYQLCQEESLDVWTCTLREISGGPRRQIANGRGASPDLAIYHALGVAAELEPEVSASSEPTVDISKLFPRERIGRRLL